MSPLSQLQLISHQTAPALASRAQEQLLAALAEEAEEEADGGGGWRYVVYKFSFFMWVWVNNSCPKRKLEKETRTKRWYNFDPYPCMLDCVASVFANAYLALQESECDLASLFSLPVCWLRAMSANLIWLRSLSDDTSCLTRGRPTADPILQREALFRPLSLQRSLRKKPHVPGGLP